MRSLRKIGADLYRRRVLFPLLIPLRPSPLGALGEEKKKTKGQAQDYRRTGSQHTSSIDTRRSRGHAHFHREHGRSKPVDRSCVIALAHTVGAISLPFSDRDSFARRV